MPKTNLNGWYIALWVNYVPRKMPNVRSWYALYTNMRRFIYCMLHLMYECSVVFTIQSVSLALYILFSHDIFRKIRPLSHISVRLLFILFVTTSKYDVSPWYWSFRRQFKLMWWWTRLEISWFRAFTSYCLPKQIDEDANSLIQEVLRDISMFYYLN